ncbi:hva22-like protein k [Anaeramoeba flamelloides]|uniref:Hva22-like protein k n=1 Tax=Anaeramoeba flamelloides TaxID=1746091 RepID=A0ABQ8YKX7_9EUKA|nr:hva22-like protein k [Anaeramoeba flamelloides]
MLITLSLRESFSELLSYSIGLVLPIYYTFKALNNEDVGEEENIRAREKWLRYWMVFGSFLVFQVITNFFFSWFPFYYELKIIISILIVTPKINTLIYHLLSFYLVPFESSIDETIDEQLHMIYDLVVTKFGYPGRIIFSYLFDDNGKKPTRKRPKKKKSSPKLKTQDSQKKISPKLQMLKSANSQDKEEKEEEKEKEKAPKKEIKQKQEPEREPESEPESEPEQDQEPEKKQESEQELDKKIKPKARQRPRVIKKKSSEQEPEKKGKSPKARKIVKKRSTTPVKTRLRTKKTVTSKTPTRNNSATRKKLLQPKSKTEPKKKVTKRRNLSPSLEKRKQKIKTSGLTNKK